MNKNLTESIIKQIFSGLGIFPSQTQSIIDQKFLLDKKLNFLIDNQEIQNEIWGVELLNNNFNLKLLLGNCSNQLKEYALIVQYNQSPAYGCYLILDDNSEALIAYNINNSWMSCSIYLQATFLAGMEGIKDFVIAYSKISDYKKEYNLLQSFINYHNNLYEI